MNTAVDFSQYVWHKYLDGMVSWDGYITDKQDKVIAWIATDGEIVPDSAINYGDNEADSEVQIVEE